MERSPAADNSIPTDSLAAPTVDPLLTLSDTSLLLDLQPSGNNWQWDNSFELGSDFNIEDFGTFDIGNASPSMPWLPLRSQPVDHGAQRSTRQSSVSPLAKTHGSWFTRIGGERLDDLEIVATSHQSTETPQGVNRAALKTSLRHPPSDPMLPPTSFLNRSIHVYTTRIWPLLPVVHLPTFTASGAHPLLLLSMCSLGALAEGSIESLEHAFRLYEGVQKAILVSWKPRDVWDPASLALIQAATIGQTFAILSPKTEHLLTARAFHGTLCVSAETFQDHMHTDNTARFLAGASPSTLIENWREWILLQTCIRIFNALQSHDGEIAATFQRRPMLRSPPERTVFAAPDSAFLAPNADAWHRAISNNDPSTSSASSSAPGNSAVFSSCAFLGSILAETIQVRLSKPDTLHGELGRLEAMLLEWLTGAHELQQADGFDGCSIQFLVHSCFIHLLCDFDSFEQVFGRDLHTPIDGIVPQIQEWVETDSAQRCLIHAISIVDCSAQLRLTGTAALHVARSIYSAGVALAVHATFAVERVNSIPQDFTTRFADLGKVDKHVWQSMRSVTAGKLSMSEYCKIQAFALASTLRRLGPWPNAQRFARTLDSICRKLES
jgi:hypothetical protein